MLKRIDSETREKAILSPYAKKACESKGRAVYEKPCDFRTDFQRDRDRIVHSKAFRRLMHKTQVFLSPEGDHYRTRLTHTLEVVQIARSIARALQLNEDLTEAIAMGHDLGHTPFGHSGEEILNDIMEDGYKHNLQSVRIVTVLEGRYPQKKGMNRTAEVIDGIKHHTGKADPSTLEGKIVKIADRIAYLNHDLDDALRSGVLDHSEVPSRFINSLGDTTKKRIDRLTTDIILTSDGKNDIQQSDELKACMLDFRKFMFDRIYLNSDVRKEEEITRIRNLIVSLLEYFSNNPQFLPTQYQAMIGKYSKKEMAKDHIAGMTDRFAIEKYKQLFVPSGWKLDNNFNRMLNG
jgi:dGTPase